ncbi:hypothetical protein HHK36_004351 [Tetracentron sinense]|uniref:Uncharacterized protein n=1 Tax=Tetracentron sinense TaxID=13715 RepID=A0A834ZSS6_TETSI|nr:hypothetical protein HHK36_004351 [Tetracentron sinense]
MKGIVVGMVGNGIADNGGNATFGIVGMIGMVGSGGNEGLGKVGNWVLGIGGSVGIGKVGMVGREGNEVVGIGGNVGLGRVGIVGSVSAGGGAEVSKRWRAARLTSMNSAMTKDKMKQCLEAAMGLVVEGGGEKKGIEVGMEGIVVGMVGIGIADNGGNATFGIVGMVGMVGSGGNEGLGKVGNWVLGNGGSVGIGKVGMVGREGNEVVGIGGNVGLGRVGIVGSVSAGGGAEVSKRWRAARLTSMHSAMTKDKMKQCLEAAMGLVVEGGGEKKGIEVGMEGIVVGMVGIGIADNGGNATFGIVGMVGMVGSGGNEGLGKVGNWVLGNGGSVGIGIVGMVGREGNEVVGIGGNVGLGRAGIVGSVSAGGGAEVSKRRRAARLTSMLDKDSTMIKDKMKQCLEAAMGIS